jgi:ketosteroid isomerase-like protein
MGRINQRDADQRAQLMAEDHGFTDSQPRAVHGREAMRQGYAMCPDYCVRTKRFPRTACRVVPGTTGGRIRGAVGPRPLLGVLSLMGAEPGK